MKKLTEMSLQELLNPEGFACDCGKTHCALPLKYLAVEKGALNKLPEALAALEAKNIFLIYDENTYRAAGSRVEEILQKEGISCNALLLTGSPRVLPDDRQRKIVADALPADADFILGVGSGVINDLCKITAADYHLPCGIVATAPSMDGYASNSSAMELSGIKCTVYTTCPSLILADTDILRDAPFDLIRAGFGDMMAKYISIADWRIARLVMDEYYCEEIARLMIKAVDAVLESLEDLPLRREEGIRRMTEGLVLSGIAMSFAGISRPASGMEHHISHFLEMFALASGRQPGSHGLQVGYGVRQALKLYEKAAQHTPTEEEVKKAAAGFDAAAWENAVRRAFGDQAEDLIRMAKEEGRYLPENILARGLSVVKHWPEILEIIRGVLAVKERLLAALDTMNITDSPEDIGYTKKEAADALLFNRDLRARKYVFTSLCGDIGLMPQPE